jgi:hypothetical protein
MPKKAQAKKTTFGTDLIEDMKLVLAHRRGRIELEQFWPKPVDGKAIRKRVRRGSKAGNQTRQPELT